MIGFLGVPGALVELPYRGGLSTSADRPVSFTRTLGGKRKGFVGARSRREWSVSFDPIGSRDVAGLLAVAQSAGPVMWYPADAAAGNLLSPQAAGFEVAPTGATDTGLAQLPDGTVARSVAASGTVRVGAAHGNFEMVPVRPGMAVSVGAWGLGRLGFQGYWRDAAGASITTHLTPSVALTGWEWREVTLTPPAGAAFIELHLFGGSQYARPSISWGTKAQDRPGRGAPATVAHGLSEALTVVTQDDAYGSIDITITEVG